MIDSATERLTAVGTLVRLVLGGQVAEDVESPSTVLREATHRGLRRYGTEKDLSAARAAGRSPVLLIPPLAVPARAYDLAPGQSVVQSILEMGRIPYVVDFGDMSRKDKDLGFADFFDDIVPEAIDAVLGDYFADATEVGMVDLAAWSLGGTISLLTAAAHPDLRIRSVTAIGTPLNYSLVPPYPAVRKVMKPTGGKLVTGALQALGGIPAPFVRIAYRGTAWQRELKKPGYILRNAQDADALARMQVIDRFQDSMPGYPGKVSVQMWENLVYRDEIATGIIDFGGRRIDLTSITQPIQLFGSHRDAIVSWAAARHGVELFGDAEQVHFTTVETSHLGLITGAEATAITWPRVQAFWKSQDDEA